MTYLLSIPAVDLKTFEYLYACFFFVILLRTHLLSCCKWKWSIKLMQQSSVIFSRCKALYYISEICLSLRRDFPCFTLLLYKYIRTYRKKASRRKKLMFLLHIYFNFSYTECLTPIKNLKHKDTRMLFYSRYRTCSLCCSHHWMWVNIN